MLFYGFGAFCHSTRAPPVVQQPIARRPETDLDQHQKPMARHRFDLNAHAPRHFDPNALAHCVSLVLCATLTLLGADTRVLLARQRTLEFLRKRGMRRAGDPDAWKIGVTALRRAGIVHTFPSHATFFVDGCSFEHAHAWIFPTDAMTKTPRVVCTPRQRRRKQVAPVRSECAQ